MKVKVFFLPLPDFCGSVKCGKLILLCGMLPLVLAKYLPVKK